MTPSSRKSLACRSLLALLLLGIAGSAMAQWKWRDATGKVLYSDLPPPAGIPEKDVLQRPPSQRQQVIVRSTDVPASAPRQAASPASAPPSKAELEQQAKQKAEQEQQLKRQKEEERKVAEQRAENCKRASNNLRALEEGIRISRRTDAGETVYLDEKQRAEEVARTRAIVSSDCR